jgi:hypothetical protein
MNMTTRPVPASGEELEGGSSRANASNSNQAGVTPLYEASAPEVKTVGVSRKKVVTRLWRAAERQVAEIENRVSGLQEDPQALERDAKTLAIIAKTIRDLVAIDAEAFLGTQRNRNKEQSPADGIKILAIDQTKQKDADDEGFGPRDIEGFRNELARRLDELRHERGGSEAY